MEEAERLVRMRQMARSGEARRIRLAAELTLREVAAEVGVDAGTVSRWEAGLLAPRCGHALRWEEVLAEAAAEVAAHWGQRFSPSGTRKEQA
jgi:transcriptional regulator with XRE-family HTH domain